MTESFFRSCAGARLAFSLLTAAFAAGCTSRTAQLEVIRPAMLNAAPFGNTFEVREFQGDPGVSIQLQTMLRSRISSSLNHAIALVPANGGLVIRGTILRYDFHVEEQRANETCSHTETVNGTQRSVNHACVVITITGIASATVNYSVVVAATNQIIFSREYPMQSRGTMRRKEGPYPADNVILGQLDQPGLMGDALTQTVDQFARVILPWSDTVEVSFEGCAGDARCNQAYEAVQAQRLEVAEQILTAVTGPDGAPVTETDRNRVSEAVYNRAMVRMLRGTYGGAFMDLQRAIELRPDKEDWRGRFQALEQLARDQDALRAQQGLPPPDQTGVQVTPTASDAGSAPIGDAGSTAPGQPSAWGAQPNR